MLVETPKPEPIPFHARPHKGEGWKTGAELSLLHYEKNRGGRPVLLIHGASAGSDTFRINERKSLVDDLLEEGFDVWMLDWRGSRNRIRELHEVNPRTDFTLDASTFDVVDAIQVMRKNPHNVRGRIGLVAHCVGGAIVAQALARGLLSSEDVDHVVITTLALFYRASRENWLKAQDHILEYLWRQGVRLFHPTDNWGEKMEGAFSLWRETPFRHPCNIPFCWRISYMFGLPYRPDDIPSVHQEKVLAEQFGPIPMEMYIHGCQNLRRGWAGKFYPPDVVSPPPPTGEYLQPEGFKKRYITLITGAENKIWHRDSIDCMYEWLCNSCQGRSDRHFFRKQVLPRFGHQDLFWSTRSSEIVFPLIREGLTRTEEHPGQKGVEPKEAYERLSLSSLIR